MSSEESRCGRVSLSPDDGGKSDTKNVVIQLTHHKNSSYTGLKVLGVYFSPRLRRGKNMGRSIILLFTAFLVGVLKG